MTEPAATILCPGPSLRERTFTDAITGSTVLAVNAAIYHHAIPCHYWVAMGPPSDFLVDGETCPWGANDPPVVVTSDVESYWRDWLMLSRRWHAAGSPVPMPDRPTYTVLAAIRFARSLGAQRIRILGADMAGSEYAYGKPGNATDGRWASERRLFAEEIQGLEVDVWRQPM